MTTTNIGVNTILSLLAELGAERGQIEREMKSKLTVLEEKIAAVETTLHLLETKGEVIPEKTSHVATVNDLIGVKRQIEALKVIARSGDGTVNATKAANLLIAARLATGKKRNVGPHLYQMMKDSDEWVWESPGTFRLIEDEKAGFTSESIGDADSLITRDNDDLVRVDALSLEEMPPGRGHISNPINLRR